MSENSNPLIQKALGQIEELSIKIIEKKKFINQALELDDQPPMFQPDELTGIGTATATGRASVKWEPGDFYGKSFSGAVREILERRSKAAGGKPSPTSVDEIHDALAAGSYAFETTGGEHQKNSIRISLGKNSGAFARLPNSDLFGLNEWYGAKVKKAARPKANGDGSTPASSPTTDEDSGNQSEGEEERE